MVQAPSAEFIAALRNSDDEQYQLQCLKQIKHSIIGHDQRKEQVVKNGLIDVLTNLIRLDDQVSQNGVTTSSSALPLLQLECVIIIAALADGGAQFVAPLLAAGVDKRLTAILQTTSDEKSTIAVLRALRNFAHSYALYVETDDSDHSLKHDIFTQTTISSFLTILRSPRSTITFDRHATLVCDIIYFAARPDEAATQLKHADVVDTLAALLTTKLATVDTNAFNALHSHNTTIDLITKTIQALSIIISDSPEIASRFVHSPAIKDTALTALKDFDHGARRSSLSTTTRAIAVLPTYSLSQYRMLRDEGVISKLGTLLDSGSDTAHLGFAVILWLLSLIRITRGITRLAALRLISQIDLAISEADNVGLRPLAVQKLRDRERHLAILAIPLAVKLVQETTEPSFVNDTPFQTEQRQIKEEACDVLARLISKSKELQCSAEEAGAIPHVCSILRKSLDNIVLAKPMWIPHAQTQAENLPASCQLGKASLPQEVAHVMRCRNGALSALAAIAAKEDLHRKKIVESGVVSCIIACLTPMSEKFDKLRPKTFAAIEGNSIKVLLAACRAALALSRSVSLLRTSLIDAGIAKPIFDLIHHPRPDIQLAATNVCTNLLLDFSPMREDLLAKGVVPTLCEHVKNGSKTLQTASMWALKHLVLKAPMDLKLSVLNSLGAEWIVETVSRQPDDAQIAQRGIVGPNSANAAGERVDLLNPSEMEIDRASSDEQNDDENGDGELLYDEASHTHYHASSIRSTLHLSPTTSRFPDRQTLQHNRELAEDLAIQTETLDFLRNLVTGDQCSEMVEHLFQRIGQQTFLDILTAKLSPISTWQHRHHLRPSTTSKSNTRQLYHTTDTILSTVHLVVHIANGNVSHKSALIAHKSILTALQAHFAHPEQQVRVMCVWFINALTYVEDQRDIPKAKERALELRVLGLENLVRSLQTDPDQDVRERVKTAIHQLDGL